MGTQAYGAGLAMQSAVRKGVDMYLVKLDASMTFDPMARLRSPGDVLVGDYLQPNAISLAQLARRSGIPASMLKQIALGRRRITAEFAFRLSCVMQPTAAYWLVLQARYDLATLDAARSSRRAMRHKIPSTAEAVAASGRDAMAHDNAKAVVDSPGLPRSR